MDDSWTLPPSPVQCVYNETTGLAVGTEEYKVAIGIQDTVKDKPYKDFDWASIERIVIHRECAAGGQRRGGGGTASQACAVDFSRSSSMHTACAPAAPAASPQPALIDGASISATLPWVAARYNPWDGFAFDVALLELDTSTITRQNELVDLAAYIRERLAPAHALACQRAARHALGSHAIPPVHWAQRFARQVAAAQ